MAISYRIRDWSLHFEQDRSKQWKILKWVPIPNKQGKGYRKIMAEKNGLEIFACWIALVQQASLCNPRGDLSKYNLSDLSLLTLISSDKLQKSIEYCSQTLDWIEVIENLDKNVNNLDKTVSQTAVGSSMLCSSVLCNSPKGGMQGGNEDFELFWTSYPRKQGKGAAVKAWGKITAYKETLQLILTALEWQKQSEQWNKDNGQYIPMPATYLNQQRWLDEENKQISSVQERCPL